MSIVHLPSSFMFYKRLVNHNSFLSKYSKSSIFSQASPTIKEYQARKLVGYSELQMYNVVSDVKHYENFVPFCTKSTILRKGEESLKATLEIGFPPIVESYTSHVQLIKPHFVSAQCRDGVLFNYLETTWKFSPGLHSNTRSCIVDFYIKFGFKSILYSQVATMFFDKLVQQMEWAFISEAQRRYGQASVPSHKLTTPNETPKAR